MKKDRRKSSRQLTSEWNSSHGKSISARTVRRRLFNAGYKTTGKLLFFSDESHFDVFNRKSKSFVRRLPSESDKPFNFQPRVQGDGGSINIWGIMTGKGVGPLVFYDGRMNGQSYIGVIEPVLLSFIEKNFDPDATRYYVPDNAPCHKSAFSMKWFAKNKINLLDLTAVSPDFNAIENLWDIIDNKLNDYRLNNVNDLQQAILEIWTKISNETFENLVQSMPRHIKKCVCVKGNTSAKY
ncbi:unnamed protein product [Rotaria magnacalcarata]|uniref:Transposase n=1 Tax=Rotaria magnacalcarata TaxID=392030 RepID=A0A815VW79_9BILA|nr:unnamed protein product [Rotaria magnacalcarata]CAF4102571.1 unnamed protein product [Rotaria magnacalcarata]CAF4103007.1 unnamed protein product [Rotaria magnacalcarata]